jgi:hypothetical protein
MRRVILLVVMAMIAVAGLLTGLVLAFIVYKWILGYAIVVVSILIFYTTIVWVLRSDRQ